MLARRFARINLPQAQLSHCDRQRALLIRRRFVSKRFAAQALVGRSQAVRQRFLVPPSPGSNPGAPANPNSSASAKSSLGSSLIRCGHFVLPDDGRNSITALPSLLQILDRLRPPAFLAAAAIPLLPFAIRAHASGKGDKRTLLRLPLYPPVKARLRHWYLEYHSKKSGE